MRADNVMCSLVVAAALCAAGCGDETGQGTLEVTTYGEDFIEQQIPAASGGSEGLVDGYTVSFDKFLIVLEDLKVATRDGEVGAEQSDALVFDMHRAGPHSVARFDGIGARRWDRVSVAVGPAGAAAAGDASADDVKLMNDNGYSLYVEGRGSKGGQSVAFRWGFTTGTRYTECHEKTSGDGVVVPSGGVAAVEITIHGDHLFYDDLQSQDPSLRFAAIAGADDDADGEVTLEELEKVDLTTLPLDQYGTGGDGTVFNLREFITALARTVVHYQGEGHCHSEAL